jgi:23S rRNA U2552 (ribose-2'-O)-methylase RlmE/FtsJ
MEITIFRKGEIWPELFHDQEIYRQINYSSFTELKDQKFGNFNDLDQTKSRLDLLDKNSEKFRRAAAKYLHEYELVKILCKKQVLSRAYFKLYEIIYFEPIISETSCDCFFICEAPGGFIECVLDIRRKKNLQTKWISVSKQDRFIRYGNYLEETNLMHEDIMDLDALNQTISSTLLKFPGGVDLATADGGFDVKVFVAQEILSSRLILCEIYMALKTQKVGGMFVIKFFDMFSHNSNVYYLLLCSFYNYVKITKPKVSRNCNSERYLVCYGFKGQNHLVPQIYEILKNFQVSENEFTFVFPDLNLENLGFLHKIKTFNNIILYEQIKTINESIKMVSSKNNYFQNLILNIFIDRTPELQKVYTIKNFKNILGSRIKKCIQFLKLYSINMYQYIEFN